MEIKDRSNPLVYFPFVLTFFEDPKIVSLYDQKGSLGVLVYIFLVTSCYKHSYYYEFKDPANLSALIRKEFCFERLSSEDALEIVDILVKLDLFERYYFEHDGVLVSGATRDNYKAVANKTRGRPMNRFVVPGGERERETIESNSESGSERKEKEKGIESYIPSESGDYESLTEEQKEALWDKMLKDYDKPAEDPDDLPF